MRQSALDHPPRQPHRRFGIYVHIPYCRKVCPYCDFPRYEAAHWPEEEYVSALLAELEFYARFSAFAGGTAGSVYFGGGTPSLFAARSIERVLAAVCRHWQLAEDAEITLEANPGTVDQEKLRSYRSAGVNRLSIGVQSFQPAVLATLGRDHSPAQAKNAIEEARAAGFESLNADFMYAIPGLSVDALLRDVAEAVGLGATHISAYALTFKPGTRFARWLVEGRMQAVDEACEAEQFEALAHFLEAQCGFEHYEVSNFARPGYASRHNRGYWRLEPYIGAGAGACGFAQPYGRHGYGMHWRNDPWPPRYMERVRKDGRAWVFVEELDRQQAQLEFCMLALRCAEGIDRRRYRELFQADPEEEMPRIRVWVERGLLCAEGEFLRVTQQGMRLADALALELCEPTRERASPDDGPRVFRQGSE